MSAKSQDHRSSSLYRGRLEGISYLSIAPVEEEGHLEPILILHGYGGSKEEMLGLGTRVALDSGRAVILPDLPGHGESGGVFAVDAVRWMMDSIIATTSPQTGIGHSIGGRILLSLTQLPSVCAIAPPLRPSLEGGSRNSSRVLRQRRVTEEAPQEGLVRLLELFGSSIRSEGALKTESAHDSVLLLRAANDLETVAEAVHRWSDLPFVTTLPPIRGADHLSIITTPELYQSVLAWIDAR